MVLPVLEGIFSFEEEVTWSCAGCVVWVYAAACATIFDRGKPNILVCVQIVYIHNSRSGFMRLSSFESAPPSFAPICGRLRSFRDIIESIPNDQKYRLYRELSLPWLLTP